MVSRSTPDPTRRRVNILFGVLFIAYLCVGMALPVVPVFVTRRLGLDNVWAGFAVGVAFMATIVSRGYAGKFSDEAGVKRAVLRGLGFYSAGALVCMVAGLAAGAPLAAYGVLLGGRILIGVGESLVAVAVGAWCIGLAGPARSSFILSMVGAAIYGALAVGGPFGLMLLNRVGLAGAMGVAALLPCVTLLAILRIPPLPPHPGADRPSFLQVLGRIRLHGAIVCLHGIGFAAIGAFFALHFLHRHWAYAGLGLTAFGAGFVLVRLTLGTLPDRIGGVNVAIGSLIVEAIGQTLIWGGSDPVVALIGAFCTGLGCSLIYPAMGREVVRIIEPHLRATALGGFTAFQDVAYGLTGPIAGLVADRAGYGSAFLIGALAAAAGLGVALVLRVKTAAQPAT